MPKTITFRQWLFYTSLAKGYSGAEADDFIRRFIEKHPNADLGEKATQESWDLRHAAGTLPS